MLLWTADFDRFVIGSTTLPIRCRLIFIWNKSERWEIKEACLSMMIEVEFTHEFVLLNQNSCQMQDCSTAM